MKRFVTVIMTILIVALFPAAGACALETEVVRETEAAEYLPLSAATAETFEMLETVVQSAQDGDTIVIGRDIVFTRSLTINKSLTFEALNGTATLYVSGNFRHFNVEGQQDMTMTLKNVVIDGRAGDSGAPLGGGFSVVAPLTIKGGVIQYCTAANGGGLYSTAPLSLEDTVVQYCQATYSYNSYSAGGGGLFMKEADVTLQDVIFRNNESAANGGAVFIDGSNNSDVQAKILGSSLFQENSAHLLTLTSPSGLPGTPYGGGAIFLLSEVQMDIVASQGETIKFLDNAADKGGAIVCFAQKFRNELSITADGGDIIFSGNKADKTVYYSYGGAIFNFANSGGFSDIKINAQANGSVQFADNQTNIAGGAICQFIKSGDLCNSLDVRAESGGHILFQNNQAIDAKGAAGHGGALYSAPDACATVLDGTGGSIEFIENYAPTGGGAISTAKQTTPGNNGFTPVNSTSYLGHLAVTGVTFTGNRTDQGTEWLLAEAQNQAFADLYRQQIQGAATSHDSFDTLYNNHDIQCDYGRSVIYVTYYLNDGSGEIYETALHAVGNAITAPTDPPGNGSVFHFWSESADGQEPFDFSRTTYQRDISLYAQWSNHYSVTYSSQFSEEPYVVSYFPGDIVTVEAYMFDLPDNADFLGWSLAGEEKEFYPGDTFVMRERDYHLEAVILIL